MCGILVVFSKTGQVDLERCDRALGRLKLRGPDFSFSETMHGGRLYCGQTVLSITGNPVDVLETYHRSKSGRFDLIFNGEIYNHDRLYRDRLKPVGYRRQSGTDTEIFVNLHDVANPGSVYDMLRGMFAYVLYDNLKNTLTFGRDMIGEKILYMYEDDQTIVIASEVGPILEAQPNIILDIDVLRGYFSTRHLLTTRKTVFQNIRMVPSGQLLELDLTTSVIKHVHTRKPADLIDPERIKRNKFRSIDDLADELDGVFQSTAKSIAPESVDYASVMSGGIDSSLSSLYMNGVRPPSQFVSLQFSGKDKISEALEPFEERIGGQITRVNVDADLFASYMDDVYRAVCSPLPTHSFVSQAIVSRQVRKMGSKVWVGGHAGDELFGGYEYYKRFGQIAEFPETNPSVYSGYSGLGVRFNGWEDTSIREDVDARWRGFSDIYEFEDDPVQKMVQTVLYSDTVVQLESIGIREADTMSMLNSVEPRCFYLGRDVLEFALNLPALYKINPHSEDPEMVTRPLMKRLFIRKFGKELLHPKQGFSGFPNEAGHLLTNGEYPLVREVLGLTRIPEVNGDQWRALEWKLQNTEMFLQRFAGHV